MSSSFSADYFISSSPLRRSPRLKKLNASRLESTASLHSSLHHSNNANDLNQRSYIRTGSALEKVVRPIAFFFFMIYWILKEPIIRIITFFTMIVSTIIIDPILYASNLSISARMKKSFAKWCSLILLSGLIAVYLNHHQELIMTGKETSIGFIRQIKLAWSSLSLHSDRDISELYDRLNAIDGKVLAESSRISLIQDKSSMLETNLESLQSKLTDTMFEHLSDSVFVYMNKDGQLEIPPQLLDPTSPEVIQEFAEKNKATVNSFLEGNLEQQEQDWVLLSKGAFLTLVAKGLQKGASEDVSQMIDAAIHKYHQDTLNMPDFALASRGGNIIYSRTSPSFDTVPTWYRQMLKSLGIALPSHPPIKAIMPSTHAGECWRMKGDEGTLGIFLSRAIAIQAITIEHPSKEIMLHGIKSAPKDLEFYGYTASETTLMYLGSARYDIEGPPVQTFDLDEYPLMAFSSIIVEIKSNWGNAHFTDVYRVRVHGSPL